jgi:hypothetical protein
MRPINPGSGSRRERPENSNRGESTVATIWLVFYVLILVAAIASPVISGAIELAAR